MTPTGLGRFLKRGRAGQSIVILALGFIALIAFVGIVTDVSLLFVRYSTLRRAVDAAAVAAATQMRRVQNTSSTVGVDTGGSTSVANMNLAARQFLNLYSLDPSDVTVETCQSQMVAFQDDGQPTFTGIFDDNGRMVMSPEQQEKNYNDVCKDGRKLVRVTASIQSPTVFLRMLGMQDVTLTVSSISETAVLDVALVMDVSESMLDETTYSSYENATTPHIARILPGHAPNGLLGFTFAGEQWWNIMTRRTEPEIQSYALDPANASGVALLSDPGDDLTTFSDDAGDPETPFPVRPVAKVDNGDGTYTTIDPGTDETNWDNDPRVLRKECRTRFWPNAQNLVFGADLKQNMLDDYRNYFFKDGSGSYSAAEKAYFGIPGAVSANPSSSSLYYRYSGWVPTYDYYGCCNDPNGDGDFSDLVCEPMKQARDASIDFLSRVDFPRGDAVAVISFSQSAYVIRPNGPGTDPWIRGNQQLAQDVVQQAVGVRAEPVYYYDDPASYTSGNKYQWDGFTIGQDTDGNRIPGGYSTYWDARAINSITTFPVHNNCPFDMATLLAPWYPNAGSVAPLLYGIQTPDWLQSMSSISSNYPKVAKRSYDYRGSCRDTNIGGALSASGNVFSELGQNRTEGSVWVMVLLSDGAAGATNPITNQDNPNPDKAINDPTRYQQRQSNPYAIPLDANGVADRDVTDSAAMATLRSTLGAQYGSFGFCPYGTSDNPGRLATTDSFPYCSDIYPNSRHSCASTDPMEQNPKNNPVYIDLGSNNAIGCAESYDPDDYARDWADYVAGVTQQNVSTTQLPVIFTIGFNLTYPNKTGCTVGDSNYNTCLRNNNTESYLGEELLRYIGDAGDNFRIDDDYWQWKLAKLGVFADPDPMSPTNKETFYGLPGPCENPDENPITTNPASDPVTNTDNHQMSAPGANCGNYFNAPDQTQLAEVFNEIASRMFTRLSQ